MWKKEEMKNGKYCLVEITKKETGICVNVKMEANVHNPV